MRRSTLAALLILPLVLQAQNMKLPWSENFDSEQAFERFTVLDANDDEQTFKYDKNACTAYCVRTQDADDWLVSPALKLKADKSYELAYTVSGETNYAQESYEVKLGTDRTAAAMKNTIAAKTVAPADFIEKATVKVVFSIDADGEYYIGWHFNTEMQLEAGGFSIYNIELKEMLGESAPAAVTDVKIVPATNGGHSAVITFTAPTKDMGGKALTKLTKIEVYRGEELVKTFDTPAPGAALGFTDTNIPNGINTYRIVPVSDEGEGEAVEVSAFIGIDVPAAVSKLSLIYNEGKALLKWNTVTKGANDEYVNPETITYTLKRAKTVEVAKGIKASSYEDTPPVQDIQEALVYNIAAVNEAGESKRTYSNVIVTGKPYTLPVKESFANGKLSNFWFIDYGKLDRWTLFYDDSNYSQDGDRGFIGFTPKFVGEWSVLESGLIDLGKAKDPVLSFYYKTHQNSEDVFKVWVSKDYGVADTIASINLQEVELREWIKVELPLKKFVGSKIIQIAFDCKGSTETSNLYLDNINIFDRKTNDLEIKMKEAPGRLRVDNTAAIIVDVTNYGTMAADNYTVTVYNGREQLASTKGAAVAAGKTVQNTVTFIPQRTFADTAQLYAKVEVEGDENLDNNTTDTVTVAVKFPSYPTAKDLKATAGTRNTLAWNIPDAPRTEDQRIVESFETYPDFTNTNIGDWLLYDVDSHTVYGFNETSFPGMGDRQAWTVFNYAKTTPASSSAWKGHTGDKVLISFGAPYATTENWLVSPELPGKAQTVSFWSKAFKGTSKETYSVMYSTTGFNRSDFVMLEEKHVVPEAWTEEEYNLPEGTKYFAIVASSADGYATLIDDINFLPDSTTAQDLTLMGYNIYRDGVKVNDVPVKDTKFTDTMGGAHRYHVTAVYDKGEAKFSNEAEITTADGIVEVSANDQNADQNAPRYDLSGHRVSKNYKGIYITKGKKHIAK